MITSAGVPSTSCSAHPYRFSAARFHNTIWPSGSVTTTARTSVSNTVRKSTGVLRRSARDVMIHPASLREPTASAGGEATLSGDRASATT